MEKYEIDNNKYIVNSIIQFALIVAVVFPSILLIVILYRLTTYDLYTFGWLICVATIALLLYLLSFCCLVYIMSPDIAYEKFLKSRISGWLFRNARMYYINELKSKGHSSVAIFLGPLIMGSLVGVVVYYITFWH